MRNDGSDRRVAIERGYPGDFGVIARYYLARGKQSVLRSEENGTSPMRYDRVDPVVRRMVPLMRDKPLGVGSDLSTVAANVIP